MPLDHTPRSFKTLLMTVSLVLLSPLTYSQSNLDKPRSTESVINAELSLETIMADPDWMGRSPTNPSWSLDNKSISYQQKALGHGHNNDYRINLNTLISRELTNKDQLKKASNIANLNKTRTKGVFTYQNDVFVIDIKTGSITQITADQDEQTAPAFVSKSKISYRVGYNIFVFDLDLKLERQIVSFKLTDNPESNKDKNYLGQSQIRLLGYLKNQERENKFQKERIKSNQYHSIKTWYLGKENSIRTFSLSPDASSILIGTVETERGGKADHMPRFVTADGYVKDQEVRSLVGTAKPLNETFFLFDLVKFKKKRLSFSKLPGINDDPLQTLRKKAAKLLASKYKAVEGERAVSAFHGNENQGVEWSANSRRFALMLLSYDNKSRWIVSVEPKNNSLSTSHWLSDEAWVNDRAFNQFGWLVDDETLYYLSEEDGYSHLYIKNGKRKSTQLTRGKFEVSDLSVSIDGKSLFYRANKKHPGIYEIYVLDLSKRESRPVTDLGGMNSYVLSPDNKRMVVTHSTTTLMPELYLQSVNPGDNAKQLTRTMSKEFSSIKWQAPEIIGIKSSDVAESVYSRVYTPRSDVKKSAKSTGKKPAVIFVHGAGYLQNSHQGWSRYFREYMFHNYLTRKGYVVLDMDYRASKGYGRDWRTAIYRNMGTPELQDLKDGVKWLVNNKNVDAKRIGVYGGSYGGFLTFMALFKEPELFASGAALRPVTDWSHYNHGYTSNILNTPEVDPKAYQRSSPIEFAEGLKKPLLICHGMLDDNVFFKDSVRLVQKLIELKKTQYFETAIYPVEPHGFKQPSSWLDEYTRIDQLFDNTLK